jgi:diaminopimelate epimerase
MNLNFFKMQAQGNDYLYFDYTKLDLPSIDFSDLARHICDRHYGVGADGIVLILPSDAADAYMRIFNADGSEAEMCGSALRSVCGYLSSTRKVESCQIETLSGIKTGNILHVDGRVKVKVDMGIPKILDANLVLSEFNGIYVDMGNPHYIIFVDTLPGTHIPEYVSSINKTAYFPNGINIEFVRIDDKSRLTVQVWERGSGATLACGTGACAVAYAGYQVHKCNNKLQIDLPGGFVETEYDPSSRHISLTGEVVYVFKGTYHLL